LQERAEESEQAERAEWEEHMRRLPMGMAADALAAEIAADALPSLHGGMDGAAQRQVLGKRISSPPSPAPSHTIPHPLTPTHSPHCSSIRLLLLVPAPKTLPTPSSTSYLAHLTGVCLFSCHLCTAQLELHKLTVCTEIMCPPPSCFAAHQPQAASRPRLRTWSPKVSRRADHCDFPLRMHI
jgi:hypothetical protein